MSQRATQDEEDMPKSFWRFNVGHLLTIVGGVCVAWMGTLAFQHMFTALQDDTTANERAAVQVATDLRSYKEERSRIDSSVATALSKIQGDVAYVRGRLDGVGIRQ